MRKIIKFMNTKKETKLQTETSKNSAKLSEHDLRSKNILDLVDVFFLTDVEIDFLLCFLHSISVMFSFHNLVKPTTNLFFCADGIKLEEKKGAIQHVPVFEREIIQIEDLRSAIVSFVLKGKQN